MRGCRRTQYRAFCGHLAFEANWKGTKAQSVSASWADCKSKTLSFWSVVVLYSVQQQWTISWSDCDVWWKMDFIWQSAITNSVVGLRSSEVLPKAKLAPPKNLIVTVWWSAAHLIHYSFLNPSETITSEKYAQQIDKMHWKLQRLQSVLVNRRGPMLLHDNTWPYVT